MQDIVRKAQLPNPAIVVDLMLALVLGTSGLAALGLWGAVSANWYFDHVNALIAALMALLAGHRLYLGVRPRVARAAWIAVLLLFMALAVIAPFDSAMDRIETALGIDDFDDLCFWFVLPCALLVALRSERAQWSGQGGSVRALPVQLLIGGFIAQTVSTGFDLVGDDQAMLGHFSIDAIVDFTEFVYLQLYFVGLTLTMVGLYLQRGADEKAANENVRRAKRKPWRLRWASTRLDYLRWRATHWRGGYGAFYSRSIDKQLKSGGLHRTLGTHSWDKAGAPAWAGLEFEQRGLEILPDLEAFGLTPDQTCVDYGCGSLRIGQHLIRALDPGHYWGLDVTDTFFGPAAQILAPEVTARAPNLHVIGDDVLAQLERRPPDFVFSYAVVKHVPPRELNAFFDRFMRLIGPNTTALIYFADAPTERIAPMSWLHPAERLVELVLKRKGDAAVGVTRIGPNADFRRRHPRSVLWIAGAQVDRPMPPRLLVDGEAKPTIPAATRESVLPRSG
jgi:hypothetical protein